MKQLSTLLLIVCLSFRVFGQQETMPKACTNPGNGILVGGDFAVSPSYACLGFSSNSATIFASNAISPSGGQFSNLGYIFNFKDGDPLVFGNTSSTTVSKPGTYWIMQGGNEKGAAYVTCKSFEVIQTEVPDIKVSSCGDKSVTVTFLNTPKNHKHGKYRILWGDGSQDFTNQSQLSFPIAKTHIYTNPPTSQPLIVAIYTRGNNNNIDVCQSTPYSFNSVVNNKPVINELENLNVGESTKLTVSAGLDGQEYNIQKKTDKGNWTNTGKTITRNSGISSATQTIDGLSKDSLYCFRLQLKDECNNEVLSDELCQIKLNAKIISGNEAELSWNIPPQKVRDYLIFYSENPSGANPNRMVTKNNFQKIDFLDCNKKYSFQVFANLDVPFQQIRSISTNILIDPSSIKEFPAPDNISTVSVFNQTNIKYNIYEQSNKKPKYHFYRSVNNAEFVKIAVSTQNFYNDTNVETEKNYYCYAYKYENDCGVLSELSINNSCSIKLTINGNQLNWTPSIINNKSLIETDYYIEEMDKNGLLTSTSKTKNSYFEITERIKKDTNNSLRTFRVQATNKFTINVDGQKVLFPFSIYSNTVTYNPILSTSKEADRFNIYPNPSEDFVQLSSTLQLKTVEIVDLQGKVIENQAIENGQVSVKHLPKGKYILRLYGNDKKLISSKAIIKM